MQPKRTARWWMCPQRRFAAIRASIAVLLAMGIVVGFFALLQRSLIYFPTRQAPIRPEDAGLPPGQVHKVSTTTEDGLVLNGWHVLPDGLTAASDAQRRRLLADEDRFVVLFFSGNAGNRTIRVDEFSLLTGLGCHVFLFDYRGYGDNPGSPSEKGLLADARAVWKAVHRDHGVPRERIVLYGESLGGAVAIALAAELCDADTPPAGLVVRSTFTSLVDAGRYHFPWLPVRIFLLDRFPSEKRLARVTCPFLQLHGVRDTIVPIQLGRRLFEKAPEHSRGGIAKRFVELPADHNDVCFTARRPMQQAVAEFLETLRKPAAR